VRSDMPPGKPVPSDVMPPRIDLVYIKGIGKVQGFGPSSGSAYLRTPSLSKFLQVPHHSEDGGVPFRRFSGRIRRPEGQFWQVW